MTNHCEKGFFIFTCMLLDLKLIKCTTDVNLDQLLYVSNHLTEDECKKLVASMYFTSYELPVALNAAIQYVPTEPCIKLLIKWNSRTEKWEGATKTHVDIAHRLRQIKRDDLAEWLSKVVFYKLSEDVKDIPETIFIANVKEQVKHKLYKDKVIHNEDSWTVYDSILFAIFVGCILVTITTFCWLVFLCFTRNVRKDKVEEEINLLSRESIDSDQETIFEYAVKCENIHIKRKQ